MWDSQTELNAICPLPDIGKKKYGTFLLPDACDAFREKAKSLRISQAELHDILSRILDEPDVIQIIENRLESKRKITQP